jgi:ElaA protein
MNNTVSINWQWRSFDELNNTQLYQLLKLRQDVFILEQECLYPDIDGLDSNCIHLLGYEGEILAAYLRFIPPEYHSSNNIAFGRITSLALKRGVGIGFAIMHQAMDYALEHYPNLNIQLGAQCYLQGFYEKFNFKAISEPYDEDGIMHIDMLFKRENN